jgi:uncharacterized protein
MTRVRCATRPLAHSRSQESLVAAMMEPAFYPRPPAVVTHRETHISHLFFAGDLVYKVKKAVRFSFLDFSTLAKRRHFLQEELRLNRRMAPSVYLGVMPIGFDESGWRLGGWAEPAEYTLVMRRLPEKRMLPFLLETKQLTVEMIAELATLLAGFHASAEIVRGIDPSDYLSTVQKQWDENLAELEPFLESSADHESMGWIKSFGAEFIMKHRDLLARRVRDGWVRDVHGDLHAEHICFAPEGIQVFDCIEFNAHLRRCDLAAEIGFLLMDLSVRGGEFLVEPFLTRYGQRIHDAEMDQLLPFFECYRALVRAKVHALRLGQWNDEAARYFSFARRLTWEPLKPFLVLVCGLTGSGKSTLGRELARRLGLTVINSDVVRKQIAGNSGRQTVSLNQGIYSPTMTEKTYAAMTRAAKQQVLLKHGAILDATFIRRAQREKIARLAERYGIPLLVIHCSTPDAITQNRLRRRAAQGTDISDGRWDIYVAQKAAAEPPDEIATSRRLELDTDAPLEQLASHCEIFLRSSLAHARAVGRLHES